MEKVHLHYMQSEAFAEYLQYLGWHVHTVGKGKFRQQVFTKTVPLLGTMAKFPKAVMPLPFAEIQALIDRHHIALFRIELNHYLPSLQADQDKLTNELQAHRFYKTWLDCELQTILIDLLVTPTNLIQTFPRENTRRNVRAVLASSLQAAESDDIGLFYTLHKQVSERKKFYCPPFAELQAFWEAFAKRKQATIVIVSDKHGLPLAGVLLVFFQQTAFYRYVGATVGAEAVAAPTLAVWHSLLIAQQRGCLWFDFGGVNDERQMRKQWQGYSHFKVGFSFHRVRYMAPYAQYNGSMRLFSLLPLLQRSL